jgi:hypothetical protein
LCPKAQQIHVANAHEVPQLHNCNDLKALICHDKLASRGILGVLASFQVQLNDPFINLCIGTSFSLIVVPLGSMVTYA